MRKFLVCSLFLGLGLLSASVASLPDGFQRGVCVEGGPRLQEANIQELQAWGVTYISLNPFGWMAAPDQPEVRLSTGRHGNENHRWWGESDDGLRQYTKMAHQHGLKVMLRPHLWLGKKENRKGQTNLWLGDVAFETEQEWQTFFDSYSVFCLHYAQLAEELGMEWYSIGAELTRATLEHPEKWRTLIAKVRKVYKGKLIYSANWWQEAEGITFWNDLDAIGVQAYYPVAKTSQTSESKMLRAWEKHLAALKTTSEKFNRPVIFTEIGYRSAADGAIAPWEWGTDAPERQDVQERAYKAAFEAVASKPWIVGMYWWKYHVAPPAEIGPSKANAQKSGYSWQNKAAALVLKTKFHLRLDSHQEGR